MLLNKITKWYEWYWSHYHIINYNFDLFFSVCCSNLNNLDLVLLSLDQNRLLIQLWSIPGTLTVKYFQIWRYSSHHFNHRDSIILIQWYCSTNLDQISCAWRSKSWWACHVLQLVGQAQTRWELVTRKYQKTCRNMHDEFLQAMKSH